MPDAKAHLARSRAGMRLIAQLRLYNEGDIDRLRAFLNDAYQPSALGGSVGDMLARLGEERAATGKLRVEQVVGIGDHQAIVVLAAQHGGLYTVSLAVDEEYPHKIVRYEQVTTS
jgi:hypothetical protein